MSTHPIQNKNELAAHVDQQVSIASLAEDASMGAIVTVGRTPVYIEGKERWEKAFAGKKVIVTGTLRREAPEVLENAAGEHSHGVPGGRYLIELGSCVEA